MRIFAFVAILLCAGPAFAQVEKSRPDDKPATGTLLDDPAKTAEAAPARFHVKFKTTAGDFVVEVVRSWAPNGADRFYQLVKLGYYDDLTFFRTIKGFMTQFGIHPNPAVNETWKEAKIKADPVVQGNAKHTITFAQSASPDSRTTQLFINFRDNRQLDSMNFSGFGHVIKGGEAVDRIYSGYGEGQPRGEGPAQDRMQKEGAAYIAGFPKLDRIKSAKIIKIFKKGLKPTAPTKTKPARKNVPYKPYKPAPARKLPKETKQKLKSKSSKID